MTEERVQPSEAGGNPLVRAYRWLEALVTRLLAYFEDSPIGLGGLLAILGGTFALRNIMEALAAGETLYYAGAFFVHFPLAYLPGIVLIPLVLAALSGERVEKVTKVLVFAWTLTILPPVLELLLGNTGARISYLPIQPGRFWWSVLNYFNPAVEFQGATAGVRIEGAVGVILGSYYVYLKRRKVWAALASIPVIFLMMVNVFSLPYIFHHLLRALGSEIPHVSALFATRGLALRPWFDLSDYSTALLDLLYLTPLLALWMLVYNRRKLGRLLRWGLRWETGGYALVAGLGLWLGYRAVGAGAPLDNPLDWMALLGAVLAVFHAALGLRLLLPKGSAGRLPADDDPAEAGTLSPGERRDVGAVCLLLAAGYAGTVNYYLLGALAVFLATQAFLHLKPLRLLRVWPLSGLFLGGGLIAALAVGGAVFLGGRVTQALPGELSWGLLLVGLGASWIIERRGAGLLGAALPERWRRLLGSLLPAVGLGLLALAAGAVWSAIELGALALGYGAALFLIRRDEARRWVHAAWPVALALLLVGRFVVGVPPSFDDERRGLPPNAVALEASERAADFERNDLYAHAALEWRRAVEAGDERAQALGPLAHTLRRTGRLEEAEAVLERSVALHPDHAPALVDLAATKLALGRREEGEALYRRALELWPHLSQPRLGLGRLALEDALALLELGRRDEAGQLLDTAEGYAREVLELEQHSDAAASLLATVLELDGRYEEAYELWKERVHRAPLDVGARLSLAWVCLQLDRIAEAREYLDEARELDPALVVPPGLQNLVD